MNNNQITHFQRLKQFINSIPEGLTYTTDQLYEYVGQYESSTWWKRLNKQRMYRTSTYQTYLKRLGALHKVKRGTWKVLHHIPEWFYSKHMNYLLGYSDRSRAESLTVLEASGCPHEAIMSIYIPEKHRINPFVSEPNVKIDEKVTIGVELLKSLYNIASKEQKEQLESAYPSHFETYYDFGNAYEVQISHYNGPLMIANALAPAGFEKKCLVIASNYELRTKVQGGYTFIYFVKGNL